MGNSGGSVVGSIPSGTFVQVAGHTSDSIPAASGGTAVADLAIAASRILGRKATGGVAALTVSEVLALLAVYTSAQTDSAIATAVANLVASSPSALDTLNELAAALGNDANFAATMTTALAAKAPLASPTFTGTAPVIPDAAAATQAMNRQSADARLAPLVNRVVVPAGAMLAASATSTQAANVTPVYSMPASVSWVMAAVELPAHWATCKVSARYVNLAATGGNVVLRPDTNVSADGDTIARTQQTSVTDAAGAQNVPKTVLLYTGLPVTPGAIHSVTVNRLGGTGADTLAGAIGLISLIFEKVTP